MKTRINKTVNMYLDGKYHCDVVQYALAANVDVETAKKQLRERYENSPFTDVRFKVEKPRMR